MDIDQELLQTISVALVDIDQELLQTISVVIQDIGSPGGGDRSVQGY